MVEEAIILAGGLGTRLRDKIRDLPKPMAPIGNKPFLAYLLDFLIEQNITKVVLAVGYKGEFIADYFGRRYSGLELTYSFEDENNLLGTGGALLRASKLIEGQNFFALNGDTFFDINLKDMFEFHKSKNADITVALKPIKETSRYGLVEIDENGRIINFLEKGKREEGFINGGIYLISKKFLNFLDLPEKFSFEFELLQKYYKLYKFYGIVFDKYFIDIGVPEDYERAKIELPSKYR